MEIWLLVFIICVVLFILRLRTTSTNVDFPTVGLYPIFGPWIQALEFINDSAAIIESGYQKYGRSGRSFKIFTPARWVVVATSPTILKELQNADENILSMQAAADERNSISYTLSSSIHGDPYHVKIILNNLTQRLGKIFPEIVDEIHLAFREVGIREEWVKIDGDLLGRCVSATTNRLLVGLPLSRDKEYLDCLVTLSGAVSRAGLIIDLSPRVLKPLIAYFFVYRSRSLRTFLAKLSPVFEERQRKLKELGKNWDNRPNDAIQWILEAESPHTSLYELCIRILYLDFSAIHTSLVGITHALYDLAAHPSFQEPIRYEVESVLREFGGWTKQALTKMHKLDSSLKESQRLHPVTTATIMRKALRPYTLSDGTFLPKGAWIVTPTYSINRSIEYYSNPDEFDAFRFSRLRKTVGHETRHQMVFPEDGYLSFGMGKNACPGRFFAATELKTLLAYIVCNYEFKLKGDQPRNKFFSFSFLPGPKVELLLRLRDDSSASFVNRKMQTLSTVHVSK